MANAIEIKNLVKNYNSKFQLGSIDLEIPSGNIVGLIGENGAGKTTLIKAILNIININSGSIKIFGKDRNELSVKEDIGVVLDNIFFPEILNPKDIKKIMANTYKAWDNDKFCKYLNDFGLNESSPIKTMSKGMRKKLEIATALAHNPKLLILDEPTSGLDPVVRSEVLDIFLDFIQDENHTILLSTHITSDLEHIADKIVFLDKGQIVINQTRDNIIDNYGILKCDLDKFEKIAKNDIVRYKKNKYNYDILVENRTSIKKKYKGFIVDKITLEDLMVLMIKGDE